jgi:RNA polymerase sigma factor (TIGR02999 family)
MNEVTQILAGIQAGDPHATEQLLPLVYDQLRKLAEHKLAQEKPGQTLQATALVHEAVLRLINVEKVPHWSSRGHFFGAAAEAMRRILVEQARRKASVKAGGNLHRIELSQVEPAIQAPQLDLLALDQALEQLEKQDARAAAVVKLRFFAGLTMPQVAETLSISLTTAENDWTYAKSYLRLQLSDSGDSATSC